MADLMIACPVVQAPAACPGHLTWDRPVLIIDNTERLSWERVCRENDWPHISLGCNLGVAASWNLAYSLALCSGGSCDSARQRIRPPEYLGLISSSVIWEQGLSQLDRCVDAIADPARGMLTDLAFHAQVWSMQLLFELGSFDENFWPAYHEDNDWVRRLECSGLHTGANPMPKAEVDAICENAANLRSGAIAPPDFAWQIRYYAQKWGGPPGEERWCQPFGLDVPLSWWPVIRGVPRWAART